jgi:hypothetical protein
MSISTYFRPDIHQNGPEILGVKDRENPTWWWILDAVGCSFALMRSAYWPALEECYALS